MLAAVPCHHWLHWSFIVDTAALWPDLAVARPNRLQASYSGPALGGAAAEPAAAAAADSTAAARRTEKDCYLGPGAARRAAGC